MTGNQSRPFPSVFLFRLLSHAFCKQTNRVNLKMPLYSFCSVLQSTCKITKAVQFVFKMI